MTGRKGFSSVALLLAIALGSAALFVNGLWGLVHTVPSSVSPMPSDASSSRSSSAPWATSSSTSGTSPSDASSSSSSSSSAPVIFAPATLSPSSGPVGTPVTVRAHGVTFSPTSTVEFNNLAGAQVSAVAPGGDRLTFTVPGDLGPVCKPHTPCPLFRVVVLSGTYAVSVVSNGKKIPAGSFTVTGRSSVSTTVPMTP